MNEIDSLKAELEETKIQCEILRHINQIKTGFLGRIAHELRSPLASLMGLHQLILSDLCENPIEERECIAQAYQAAQKFLKIIDDIIKISKIESGTLPLHLEKISIQKLFGDLYQLIYLQAANRNLRLDILTLATDLYFVADEQRLLFVLFLLIDGVINVQEKGTIQILAIGERNSSLGIIQINLECPLDEWKQKNNLKASSVDYSLNLKFCLSHKLITMMKGKIILKELTAELEPNYLTQIEIVLPVVSSLNSH
ncbi:sensor histidine kinase [Aphanothece hegewaldii CCALA 016]|uniref:histidine kinase n=1 Tax=Aphanothece hegewaldii CCALA 016 TaxID=2107694 RepID=A0A2T1LYH7_9CHRO|nr:histidine kinase dimerization/phospho-acceptor domain-containing protein [Aphanothece hegewaldii]PSF37446.1 sensor histidine kinase [Aphanothece hegewaldii CCALA 016]